MGKVNRKKSAYLALGILCLAIMLVTACGKKGDLYLPEEKPTEQKAKAAAAPDKTDEKKKEQKETQE